MRGLIQAACSCCPPRGFASHAPRHFDRLGQWARIRRFHACHRPAHSQLEPRTLLLHDKLQPNHRIARCAREQDRALNSHDSLACLSLPNSRPGRRRRSTSSRLRGQAPDGSSFDLGRSMDSTRADASRSGIVESAPDQHMRKSRSISAVDPKAKPPQPATYHLGNGFSRHTNSESRMAASGGKSPQVARADWRARR